MRRRDHPQIGDVWWCESGVIWTVLNKEWHKDSQTWELTILIGGNADGDEGQIKTAYIDKDFKEIEGIYWKVA